MEDHMVSELYFKTRANRPKSKFLTSVLYGSKTRKDSRDLTGSHSMYKFSISPTYLLTFSCCTSYLSPS